MTAPTWPAGLPQKFLYGSLQQEADDSLIASQVSVGPAKTRLRSTATPYPLSGSVYLRSAQYATFLDFVNTTISRRAKAFYFPDPDGGADLLVRMTAPHKRSVMASGWRVDLEFEVLP